MSTPDSKTANQGDLLGREQAFEDWLKESTLSPEIHVPEFFDLFVGDVVPKRSNAVGDNIRTDIIQACLASVIDNGGILWSEEADRIAVALHYSAWHIKTTWGRYRRSVIREETVRLGLPPKKHNGYTS